MAGELKVYENDVKEWVIAYSPEDAQRVAVEHSGYEPEHEDEISEFTECDPEKPLTRDNDYRGTLTKLPAEWVASEGRCYLMTTEY